MNKMERIAKMHAIMEQEPNNARWHYAQALYEAGYGDVIEELRKFKEEVKTKIQSGTYLDGFGNEHTAYTIPTLFNMIDKLYKDFIALFMDL